VYNPELEKNYSWHEINGQVSSGLELQIAQSLFDAVEAQAGN
jgi:hypothetical protein